MEWSFSLLDGRGRLTVREQSGQADCRAVLPDDGKGLYRCWLLGPAGRFPLGPFLPEGGELRLSRAPEIAALARQGAWPPAGGEARLTCAAGPPRRRPSGPPPGWVWEPDPARLLGEPLLREAAAGRGALLRREEGGFSLAYPFRPSEPFPLVSLFCFARVEELAGVPRLIFPFRPGGCPRAE